MAKTNNGNETGVNPSDSSSSELLRKVSEDLAYILHMGCDMGIHADTMGDPKGRYKIAQREADKAHKRIISLIF